MVALPEFCLGFCQGFKEFKYYPWDQIYDGSSGTQDSPRKQQISERKNKKREKGGQEGRTDEKGREIKPLLSKKVHLSTTLGGLKLAVMKYHVIAQLGTHLDAHTRFSLPTSTFQLLK